MPARSKLQQSLLGMAHAMARRSGLYVKKAAAYSPGQFRPSGILTANRQPGDLSSRQTYISARKPKPAAPRHFIRSGDPKSRPPSWSAEGRLNDAATTAVSAVPAALSSPAAAAIGGVTGVVRGVRHNNGMAATAAKGIAGIASGFIPGTAGILNTAGGGISDTISDAVIDSVEDLTHY